MNRVYVSPHRVHPHAARSDARNGSGATSGIRATLQFSRQIGVLLTSDDHSEHDHQDSRRLRELAKVIELNPLSQQANRLISELIVGWRRYYEPWLVLRAGRQVADPVVSSVELRLVRLLRRKQQFDSPWRSVVWSMVRNELASERRRLARRSERETAVAEVFGETSDAEEPSRAVFEDASDRPEYDVARLRRARAKLSRDDQQVLELLFDQDLVRAQAAAQLDIKPGALSVRKLRALERLRKAWDDDQGQDV